MKTIINNRNKALSFEILGKPFGIGAGQVKKVEDKVAEILLKTAHISEVKPIKKIPIKRVPISKVLKPKRKRRKGRKKINNRLKK